MNGWIGGWVGKVEVGGVRCGVNLGSFQNDFLSNSGSTRVAFSMRAMATMSQI